MAPRRRAPRRRAKKSFNISAIEAGTALSLMDSLNAAQSLQLAMDGNVKSAFTNLEKSAKGNKTKIIGTLGAAFIGKALTKGFGSGTLAKLGPIRIKA
jgi:type IV secretory pathway VirB2 component (pilin)